MVMTKSETFTLFSGAFADGRPIAAKYTADGANLSPPISWSNLPEGTQQLALIMDDPDARSPQPWVHWVAYNIRPGLDGLPEGAGNIDMTNGEDVIWGRNTWGTLGYRGPDPPPGDIHHYHFRLYALDNPLELSQGLDKAGLLHAMQGHFLGMVEMTGTYRR